MDQIVDKLVKEMDKVNGDMDKEFGKLKIYIKKNNADLEEGMTYDLLLERRVEPTINRRKEESKKLMMNSVKYMED